MPGNSESQCYFVQLQIDSFLDGELASAPRETFMNHVHGCPECTRELHFAQTLHDAVLDLPLVDCDERALEPVRRLVSSAQESSAEGGGSVARWLQRWFTGMPPLARYAMPAVLVGLLALALYPSLTDQPAAPLVAGDAAPAGVEQYSPEDIQQALQDLNLAIDYLNQVSQRTEVMIGDRFLITPLQESLNASFERARTRRQDPLQDDPI